jgi:DNA-binding response OmpR family regulator
VVDDNLDAAEAVAMSLRLDGHEVKVVADAWQALASAAVFAPQAVVLDIGLPGLNGYEIARRLRQQVRSDDMTLIALTGYGQKDDRTRALEAGFDYHFVKPASTRDIQLAICAGRTASNNRQAGAVAGRLLPARDQGLGTRD